MRRWGLAALSVVGLLTLLLRPPALLGQSGGPFIRATCSQINSPTTGESVCFNSTRGEWQVWTGSAWVAISGASNSVTNGVLFATATGTTTNANFTFTGTALTLAGSTAHLLVGILPNPIASDEQLAVSGAGTQVLMINSTDNGYAGLSLRNANDPQQQWDIATNGSPWDLNFLNQNRGTMMSLSYEGKLSLTPSPYLTGPTLVVGGTTSGAGVSIAAASVTAGSGTGVTVNATGLVQALVYKVTVLSTNCVAAATTCDLTIATLPAKTFLKAVIADLTTTYACTAVCTTATLSGTLGTSAGGTELLASMDLDAAAAQFGDADAELGASLNAAARTANGALFNGVLMSWASTTTVTYRITSGTGNLGNGAATNLSQGTMVFYLVTEVFP